MESLIEQDAWPEEDIKSAILSDEFKALIIEPVIEQQVSYTSHIEQTGGKNSAGVLVNVKDEGDEAYVACSNSLKDYVMSFVTNHGFVIEYESGEIKGNSFYYALRVRTTDLKFGVELSIMYGGDFRILTLTFVENIFGPFPSNEVRILYENDSFPVLNNTASGQFSYSVSSSSDEISITAINVSHEELVAYLSSLKDYGFSLSESDYADYHRYSANKMEITSSGAYQFYVSVNEYENYITLSYRKSEAYTENSLSYIVNKLLSYSFRSLGEDFTDALDSSFEDGEYIADYTNNIIYCMGFGQTEKDLILSVCKYDSLLNAYFFSDEENPSRGAFRIDVEVNSNHLVLQIREISSSTWQNYNNENATNNFNLLIDELFTDASSSDTPSDYYFSMNSCKFLRSWYSIYAYGNNVKDIVETYKSVLLGNSNIKYSKYLDQYINVETGTAVRFNMSLDMSIPYVAIEFSFNVDFVDYAKFSDIASSLTPFTYLNLYPSIPNAIGADSEACVFDYAYTTSASIYLIEEAYEAYKNAVMNDANFASPYDGSFERVDEEGNRARVMFSDYIYEVSFSYDESYYTSISDITASYEIDSFDFASNFVLPQDSGKIFRDSGHWGSYFSIEYAPSAFNKNAYISALNGAGFVESGVDYGDEVIYAKVVGTTSYYVKISNNTIQFSSVSYSSLLSYAELCEELEDDAFDIKKLDRFVTIPGMENNYFYSDGWGNQFTVLIADGSVTIDAYRNALINAGFEYNSQENAYILGETNVSISLCYGFLKIKF